MIKLIITDADTLLGNAILNHLKDNQDYYLNVISAYPEKIDIKNGSVKKIDPFNIKELKRFCYDSKADYIVNTKIFDYVSRAEKEKKKTWNYNAEFTETLTRICTIMDAKLIGFSSYLVFDGRLSPYEEYDNQNPLGYFGRSMLASENAAKAAHIPFIWMRLGFLLGSDYFGNNRSFDQLKEWATAINKKEKISLPDVQIQPVFADDVAYLTEIMIEKGTDDFFNIAGDEIITYEDLLHKLVRFFKLGDPVAGFRNNPLLPKRAELINFKVKTLFNYKFASVNDTINNIKLKS